MERYELEQKLEEIKQAEEKNKQIISDLQKKAHSRDNIKDIEVVYNNPLWTIAVYLSGQTMDTKGFII